MNFKLTPYGVGQDDAFTIDGTYIEIPDARSFGGYALLHIERVEPGAWRLNAGIYGGPDWHGPSFATPEECALYGLMMGTLYDASEN